MKGSDLLLLHPPLFDNLSKVEQCYSKERDEERPRILPKPTKFAVVAMHCRSGRMMLLRPKAVPEPVGQFSAPARFSFFSPNGNLGHRLSHPFIVACIT